MGFRNPGPSSPVPRRVDGRAVRTSSTRSRRTVDRPVRRPGGGSQRRHDTDPVSFRVLLCPAGCRCTSNSVPTCTYAAERSWRWRDSNSGRLIRRSPVQRHICDSSCDDRGTESDALITVGARSVRAGRAKPCPVGVLMQTHRSSGRLNEGSAPGQGILFLADEMPLAPRPQHRADERHVPGGCLEGVTGAFLAARGWISKKGTKMSGVGFSQPRTPPSCYAVAAYPVMTANRQSVSESASSERAIGCGVQVSADDWGEPVGVGRGDVIVVAVDQHVPHYDGAGRRDAEPRVRVHVTGTC